MREGWFLTEGPDPGFSRRQRLIVKFERKTKQCWNVPALNMKERIRIIRTLFLHPGSGDWWLLPCTASPSNPYLTSFLHGRKFIIKLTKEGDPIFPIPKHWGRQSFIIIRTTLMEHVGLQSVSQSELGTGERMCSKESPNFWSLISRFSFPLGRL